MTSAIDVIHADHVNIARVLDALEAAVADPAAKPDFELLERIVYYVRVFPDRLHHPKEEKFLFPALAARNPEAAPTIEELERQHAEGEKLLALLAERVHAADKTYPDGMNALRRTVDTYVAFQKCHIALEETEILPRARECVAEADWRAIDRAFGANHDPLFGTNLETGFRALHAKITAKK